MYALLVESAGSSPRRSHDGVDRAVARAGPGWRIVGSMRIGSVPQTASCLPHRATRHAHKLALEVHPSRPGWDLWHHFLLLRVLLLPIHLLPQLVIPDVFVYSSACERLDRSFLPHVLTDLAGGNYIHRGIQHCRVLYAVNQAVPFGAQRSSNHVELSGATDGHHTETILSQISRRHQRHCIGLAQVNDFDVNIGELRG